MFCFVQAMQFVNLNYPSQCSSLSPPMAEDIEVYQQFGCRIIFNNHISINMSYVLKTSRITI